MQDFKKIILIATVLLGACTQEYIYELEPVQVVQSGSEKPNRKNSVEFISIAYADVFSSSISQAELNKLSVAHRSFGDKELIEDELIKNFLNEPTANVPSKAEMLADVDQFIKDSYLRFYNREPSNYELWFLNKTISENTDINPELIYYSMMTAEEYRFY